MSRNVLLAFLALAVPAVLFVLWQALGREPSRDATGPAPAAPALESPEAPADLTALPAAPGERPTSASSTRDAVAAPEEPSSAAAPAEPAPPAAPPRVLRGRVLGPSGTPLAGVPLRRERRGGVLARSDGAGRFELEVAADADLPRLVGRGDGFAPLRVTVVRDTNLTDELVVLSAPAVDLAGHVESTDGARLAGARVRLGYEGALRRAFPLPLDATTSLEHEATADARGAFALEQVPALEGAVLGATHAGHEGASVPAPTASRADLVLRLAPAAEEPTLAGLVLLPDGEPAARAAVGFGFDDARTAADGTFELPLPRDPEPDQPLVAGLKDQGVAYLPDFGAAVLAAAPHPPPPVTLVLPGASLAIAGRVVDARGEPLEGWVVELTAGTPVSRHMTPPIVVEGFGGPRLLRMPTGADGTFRMDGLLERSYPVRAYERESLRCLYLDPVPAGTTDLEIVVPDGGVHDLVAGVVVSRTGLPVEGAKVSVGLITSQGGGGVSWVGGASTVTDAEGRFELEGVPAAHVHLDVGGEAVVPHRELLDHDAPQDDLRLEVARRCHFRVSVAGDTDGGVLEALDADGEGLMIYRFQANGWSGSSVLSLRGADGVCTVSEDAVTFVVRRGGDEVARREVVLSPEGVNEIDLVVR